MAFKFAKSEIELTYQGTPYTLKVDARMAVNLERHMGKHPISFATEIQKCVVNKTIPPLGEMAEFFEFMLKKAGCHDVDFDEVYSAMYDEGDTDGMSESIGEMLGLFMPQIDEEETKTPKKAKAAPKKRVSKNR
jgi:hypothetical protein